jgi:hypothetical protein
MHPRLLTTPFFTIHTFGVLLAAAYVAVFWWLMREALIWSPSSCSRTYSPDR